MESKSNDTLFSSVGRGIVNFATRKLSFKIGSPGASPSAYRASYNKATASALETELSHARFIAGGAESRARRSDYRDSANRIRNDLEAAKEELEVAIAKVEAMGATNEEEINQALAMLARIYEFLGNYDETESIYTQICPIPCPYKSMSSHSLDSQLAVMNTPKFEKYQLRIALEYLNFLLRIRRNLATAKSISTQLLNQPQAWTAKEDCALQLQLVLLHTLNNESAMALIGIDALKVNPETSTNAPFSIALSLEQGRAATESEIDAKEHFLIAVAQSAVVYGMWNRVTLEILAAYGFALKAWGHYQCATEILEECCLARFYQFGESHPCTIRDYRELETCEGAQKALRRLKAFSECDDDTKLSVAYAHIHLNTIFDLPLAARMYDYGKITTSLRAFLDEERPLKIDTGEHRSHIILRARRTLASCLLAQGKTEEAKTIFKELSQNIKRSTGGEMQSMLDLATFYAKDEKTLDKARALSRTLFFDVDRKLTKDQAQAFRTKLTELGLTHFPYDTIADNGLPITVLENVGTGAYAVVESVIISQRLYARKSISLPRYNQRRIRQTIQNEVSIIRSMAHAHIVKIYCTYEERSRFCIVLEPLATCDLESFLDQNTVENPEYNWTKPTLLAKWLRCLSNTLSFIHSKGIRHKDIKTRNILVKDSDIIFADFGSSHAFLDEGSSTTEGPAFGHTVMYCAPEVVAWDKRSRSADVFSLGCIFTEIATSLASVEISDYYDFRCGELENSNGRETHAYHATLHLVDAWFDGKATYSKSLYVDVIKPMLSRDPETRPTASRVSRSVETYFREYKGEELPECSKCQAIDLGSDSSTILSDPTPSTPDLKNLRFEH